MSRMSNTSNPGRGQDETTEAQVMSGSFGDEVDNTLTGAENASEGEGPSEAAGEAIKVDSETPGRIDDVTAPEEELDPEAELTALRDRHLRLAAEFDNFRRRTRRELLESGEMARAELAERLLVVMDDLERVVDTPCDETTTEALHQGAELVARKLTKTLADAGMEPVNPLNQRFDPNLHEALFVTLTGDPELDEIVSEVALVGYRIGERLLRPAQVGVFRYEEGSE